MSVGVAFKAFFAALFQREACERIREALSGDRSAVVAGTPKLSSPGEYSTVVADEPKLEVKKPAAATRSDALTLLSALQREARFVDLVQESLDGFDDSQVGAAAREVLRDCKKTLDRMFAITALAELEEGELMEVPANASPNQIRSVGGSGGRGVITHRGWRATCCEVPSWAGRRDEAWILTPTEVEVS